MPHEGCSGASRSLGRCVRSLPSLLGRRCREVTDERGHAEALGGVLVAPGLPEVLGAVWTGPQTTMAAADMGRRLIQADPVNPKNQEN